MLRFKNYLSEEVMPTVLSNGSIDIDKESVRDELNGYLSAIASRPCITPYIALNKMRKMLAHFHIYLPKRAYMEGKHGIEAWEINQFGDKMGMNDQGEFIKSVSAKYHLFFHYHLMGSHYYIESKIVNDDELEDKVEQTQKMFAESAELRQSIAKATAPKEKAHTALGDCDCSQGDSPSTKKAVKVSMKKKIEEGRGMPASVIKHKQKLANMTPEEKKKHFSGKSEEELKSMARRHGYGKDSDEYSKHVKEDKDPCWKGYEMIGMKKKGARKVPNCVPVKEEEQIDEKAPSGAKFERMVKHIKKGYSKDGLTKKEKSIAYATAWKAKKREMEEGYVQIGQSSDWAGDRIKPKAVYGEKPKEKPESHESGTDWTKGSSKKSVRFTKKSK